MKQAALQLKKLISQANRIAVVTHLSPDGDALGSVNAIIDFCQQQNNKAQWLTPEKPKTNFAYDLPLSKQLADLKQADLVIILDCSSLNITGWQVTDFNPAAITYNLDHHAGNTLFADYNLVKEECSSVCEIICLLFEELNFQPSPKAAQAMLTGLITDTGNFCNAATSATAINCAAQLLKTGIDWEQIQKNVWCDKSVAILRLWGQVLKRLRMDEQSGIVSTYLTKEDYKQLSAPQQQCANQGLANYINCIEGARMTILLAETNDAVKISLRTHQDDVDVSSIARKLGGGGHKKAAGATIPASSA